MYSERELLAATQIAYYDFNIDILKANGYAAALSELFEQDDTVLMKLTKNLERAMKKRKPLVLERAESAMRLYQTISSPDSIFGNWVIKYIKDDNEDSGFYGCLIETDQEHAIISFRGSESTNRNQVKKDWIDADLGLLNSTITQQQKIAALFMEEIDQQYSYSYYGVSGHSLGGNLAAHATLSAPSSLKKRIYQSYNFDGPGFSKEYLSHHKDEVEHMGNMITHYQWSLVGNLLFPVTNEGFVTIQTGGSVCERDDLEALTQKHDTSFVKLNEIGEVYLGEMDSLAVQMGLLSKGMNFVPETVANRFVWGMSKLIMLTEDEKTASKIFALGLGILMKL